MHTRALLGVILCLGALAGCSSKEQTLTVQELSTSPSGAAAFIGTSVPGTAASMPVPGFDGNALVTAGSSYTSGLGLHCRHATASSTDGRTVVLAACQQDKEWILAPFIFPPLSR